MRYIVSAALGLLINTFVVLLPGLFIPAGAADNLRVIGELYNDPCTLRPENKDIVVDFRDVSLPDLYDGIEVKRSFTLILSECDISELKRFKIKFSGTADPKQISYLALDASSEAAGFSLGIKTDSFPLIPVNNFSDAINLASNGENKITFIAFLKTDPDAVANKAIKYGAFNATAFMTIDYF